MTKASSNYLNVRETAARLDVHENTVRSWARSGTLASARIAGSRFLRFEESEVDRLVRQRGADVAPVSADRRFVGPDLVRAVQLEHWADFLEARGLFPELLRRLLIATPGVGDVDVRTREGTDLSGWDGQAQSVGGALLPSGKLRFELGTNMRTKVKADKDYAARVAESGDEAADETFVFVTPRRWSGGASWASDRRAEGVFADVRVFDADRLEGWLHAAPAAHYWISEELGGVPDGAATLEHWWTRFSGQTEPQLPPGLFLAGRSEMATQLIELLDGPTSLVTCRARTRDEALAFLAAALDADKGSPAASQCMVVTDAKVWHRLMLQSARILLVPLFSSPDIAQALDHGHAVVLVAGEDEVAAGSVIELGKVDRVEASEALVEAKVGFDDAQRYASEARRSMGALTRRLARDPRRAKPAWARPGGSAIPPVMALVSGWDDQNSGDQEVVAEIAGCSFDELERVLREWKDTPDPPFVLAGREWHLASAEEALLLLRGAITTGDVARWEQLAVAVLLERNPALDLPVEERYAAGARGARRVYSGVLRKALAESVALLGVTESALEPGAAVLGAAERIVTRILAAAAEDDSGAVWAGLTDVLPLLAEAAPEQFMDAVHDDLDRADPTLIRLFQDSTRGAGLFYSSPHTGLLWALEGLCWNAVFLAPAALALARLAEREPGGTLSNRPKGSLAMVFVGWVHQTSASMSQTLLALDAIAETEPDVAFTLLMDIWPTRQGTTGRPHRPRFADWDPDNREVAMADRAAHVERVVGLATSIAGTDAGRWTQIIERLTALPTTTRNYAIDRLHEVVDAGGLDSVGRLALWEALRAAAGRSRQHASAPWALDEVTIVRLDALVSALDETDAPERWAYLFKWRPEIPEIDVNAGYQETEKIASALREQAVEAIWGRGGADALHRLAERVPHPMALGNAIAKVTEDAAADSILAWIGSGSSAAEQTALYWARARIDAVTDGPAWLRGIMARTTFVSDETRALVVRNVPFTSDYWTVAREVGGGELWELFWATVQPYPTSPLDLPVAVDELLARGRAWACVDMLALTDFEGDDPVPSTLIERVLDAARGSELTHTGSGSLGFYLGRLLDALEAAEVDSEVLAAYEFAFFSVLDHHREPRALSLELARKPDLFVRLVQIIYRSKHENPAAPSDDDMEMAPHAWTVLNGWDGPIPGQHEGTVNAEELSAWVSTARFALDESGHGDVGDEQIGQVLAASPDGSDGAWPAEAVRSLVETAGSTGIETGLYVGVANRRGVTSRGVYEGGNQERELASKYRQWAQHCATRWRRTSRVLRNLADRYEREATEHGQDAAARGDTD